MIVRALSGLSRGMRGVLEGIPGGSGRQNLEFKRL